VNNDEPRGGRQWPDQKKVVGKKKPSAKKNGSGRKEVGRAASRKSGVRGD